MTRWLHDRTLDHLRALPEIPADADRYQLRDEIGRGGMGVVYRAFDRELEREVAVKVLHARLTKEAKILARLEHPGILPVHDVGTLADGRVFYVMKLVRGEPLSAHATGAAALADALRIVERLCDAAAFAHAHGVIHCDLKPENVMIGAFGEVLVLDWGVAVAADPALTSRGIVGTPGYMAPEQAAGGPVDERADVYALGGILAFLLYGDPRMDADASVPRPLAAIVRRARAADAAQRYRTAGELAEDIRRYAAGLAVGAYRESLLERVRRVFKRHRTAILLVAAYLVMRAILLLF